MTELLTLDEASRYASSYTGRDVSVSNIQYLIQYGRIDKEILDEGLFVDKNQLVAYYKSFAGKRETEWKTKLGDDINWALSFDQYTEAQTTKHVHRLHPYKGKFIPQLVAYFLDDHIDEYKTDTYFAKDDIVLDPFCGSGTTLVQANELGMNAVGIDISVFNAQISNSKVRKYDIKLLQAEINKITTQLINLEKSMDIKPFEETLLQELYKFNNQYFPSPAYKKALYDKKIDEKTYASQREKEFIPIYYEIAKKYHINLTLMNNCFLDKWYFESTRKEIYYVNSMIESIENQAVKSIMQIVLSRVIRSCRATTHSDLATLIQPVSTTYYCTKHKKICKPLFSILKWWETYSRDTITRLIQFNELRTDTDQYCFTGDSSVMDIGNQIINHGGKLSAQYLKNKISGIFSSPPYVGLIDYHEQHAYAYELFGLDRRDSLEIGSMSKGNNRAAVQSYISDITKVLLNCKLYLKPDYNIFLVANDKHNIYPTIAENAGMKIVERFRRPVLNRTEKDKNAYSETIFRLKEKSHD